MAKSMAKSAADSVKSGVAELQAAPSTVICSNDACKRAIPVPPGVFNWTCATPQCRAINPSGNSVCATCNTAKPKLINPNVQCSACGTFTIVPTSNASKHLKSAGKATKEFVVATAAATKETYNEMKSKPVQFNCSHCTALLHVPPQQPWLCARGECGAGPNDGQLESCPSCGVKRDLPAQLVLCGVCNKQTKVPSMVLLNKMRQGASLVNRGATKIYYDVAGKDYVVCPRCGAAIRYESRAAAAAGAGTAAADQKGQPVDAAVDISEEAAMAAGGRVLNCGKCDEKVIITTHRNFAAGASAAK